MTVIADPFTVPFSIHTLASKKPDMLLEIYWHLWNYIEIESRCFMSSESIFHCKDIANWSNVYFSLLQDNPIRRLSSAVLDEMIDGGTMWVNFPIIPSLSYIDIDFALRPVSRGHKKPRCTLSAINYLLIYTFLTFFASAYGFTGL